MSNRRVRLADIAELTVGYVGNMAKQYTDTGVKFLRSLNIKPFHIVEDDLKYISEEFSGSLSKSILHENDLIIVRTGMPGTCCVVPKEYENCNCADVVIVRPNLKKVNPHYLAAYINVWGKKQVENNKVGAIQKHFNVKSAEEMLIDLPDLEQQYKVAKVLTDLNGKIFINEKINDYLEQQLQLLYDYWFTQYNFPNEDGQPYKASNGLMVWNKMINHLIPADWKVNPLSTICSFRNGVNYDKNVDGNTIYKIINVRNISSSTLFLDESNFDEICLPKQQGDKYCVSDESIIIARSGIPGATRILCNPGSNIIFCGFIICCTPYDDTLQNYLTLYLRQFEGSSATQTGGSILKNVSQETLKNLIVPIPPQSLLNQFNDSILPIYNLINSNTKENVQLITLRDWLLPMLMNGQATLED